MVVSSSYRNLMTVSEDFLFGFLDGLVTARHGQPLRVFAEVVLLFMNYVSQAILNPRSVDVHVFLFGFLLKMNIPFPVDEFHDLVLLFLFFGIHSFFHSEISYPFSPSHSATRCLWQKSPGFS